MISHRLVKKSGTKNALLNVLPELIIKEENQAMTTPSVSLIIPIYNTQSYLETCLESIEAQRFQNFEVILVNDGSTDECEKICLDFRAKHPEKTIMITQENLGQGAARNAGMDLATGSYVCFVDSDDLISPEFLMVMIEAAERENADVVVTDLIKRFDSSNKEFIFKNVLLFSADMSINLMLSHPGPVAKLIRRTLIKQHELNFTEGKIYEDILFNVRLSLCAPKVVYIEAANYIYRVRDFSTMNQRTFSTKMKDIYSVMEAIEKQLIYYPAECEYLSIEHVLYSASIRFLNVKGGLDFTRRNIQWMIDKYPMWSKNPYFLKRNLKFRGSCYLIYHKKFALVRLLSRVKGI